MLLELQHVFKYYRQEFWTRKVAAVRDLSLALDSSGVVGFVGPNGAGKTTTIKMALGLIRPAAGTVRLMGEAARDPASRAGTAYVSEQPYFYPHLSVAETLDFIARLRGIGTDRHAEARRVLAAVGLQEASGRKVGQLSKGMQQRLNMAQALLGDPQFFILDEPMSGMDPPGRSLFRRIFRDLAAAGKHIFFSTHILDDVEMLCERVIVLSRGACTYDGAVGELLQSGFEGTEIVAGSVPGESRSALEEGGCETAELGDGKLMVFVPAGGDAARAQQVLSEAGVYCETIRQRRKSLETLLYAQEGGSDVS